jgi:hypothetical protein
MHVTRPILSLTLVVAVVSPVHAVPPATFNQQPRALLAPRSASGGRPAAVKSPARFVPPQTFGGGRSLFPAGSGRPAITAKPPVAFFNPPAAVVRPPVTSLRSPTPAFTPPPAALKPGKPGSVALTPPATLVAPANPGLKAPMTPLKPLQILPREVVRGERLPIAGRRDAPPRDRIPGVGPDGTRLGLRDSDRDGIADIRDADIRDIERVRPGAFDFAGGRDAGGGAGDPAPRDPAPGEPAPGDGAPGADMPADPAPPVVGPGPTAWDWVAIGLSAAAFADGLGGRHGGCYAGDGVVIERPFVRTVPADPIVVYSEPVAPAQPVVIEETVTTAESAVVVGNPAAATQAEPLPQLRAGEGFELPAQGLGGTQGRVAVKVGVVILECVVRTWTEAGLRATVPAATLDTATKADLIVALADGTVAAVVPVELLPAKKAAGAAK